jgi:hypothetical protein
MGEGNFASATGEEVEIADDDDDDDLLEWYDGYPFFPAGGRGPDH